MRVMLINNQQKYKESCYRPVQRSRSMSRSMHLSAELDPNFTLYVHTGKVKNQSPSWFKATNLTLVKSGDDCTHHTP
jgi:hypothetical protein